MNLIIRHMIVCPGEVEGLNADPWTHNSKHSPRQVVEQPSNSESSE